MTPFPGVGALTQHSYLGGLAADDHTQYALLGGRAGGQTLYGSLNSGENLTLSSNPSNDGVVSVLGNFSVAGQASLTSTLTNTSGTHRGLFVETTLSPASASSGNLYAQQIDLQVNGNNNYTGTLRIANFTSSINGNANVTSVQGFLALMQVAASAGGGGIASTIIAANVGVSNLSSNYTITKGVGFRVQPPVNSGGGTFTGACGVLISAHTAATNNTHLLIGTETIPSSRNWSIYNASTYENYLNGTVLLGTTVPPTGATFNLVFGGGATSPVLGAASSDRVSLAAVDKAALDRRLYVQSEAGSWMSFGNDRINYSAATGYVSIGGTDTLSLTTTLLTLTDAVNLAVGTGTGTKLGTATSQKLSFWNKTPIVQPTTAILSAVFAANTSGIADDTATYGGYTCGQIASALINSGLLA